MEDTQIEETKAYADYEAEQEFLASLSCNNTSEMKGNKSK